MEFKNLPVIVYGPAGCGKTRYAQTLAKYYGKKIIIDGWGDSNSKPVEDALYLTCEDMSSSGYRYTVPFHAAAKAAGIDLSDIPSLKSFEPRYCKDCVFCGSDMRWDPECTAPEAFTNDLILGPTNERCRHMRADKESCGSEGFFYTCKPNSDPEPSDNDRKEYLP